MAQALLIFLLSVASLATDAFGVVPDNPFSQDFRDLLREAFPADFIEPINQYLQELVVPTIPVKMVVDDEDTATVSLQAEGTPLVDLLAEEMAKAILTANALATAQVQDAQQTATAQPSAIPSAVPSSTPIFTQTPISTNTPAPPSWVILSPPKKNQQPSCTTVNVSNPQTTGIITINLSTSCSDPDGDSWSLASVSQGANGATTFGTTSITYDPNNGFAGTDNITFSITDIQGNSFTNSVAISIANVLPVANIDTVSITRNSSNNTISVLSNDTDAGNDTLTITAVSTSANSTMSITPGGGTLTYTPNTNYIGLDSFTYTISDGNGGTQTGTLNIEVKSLWCSTSAGVPATEGCQISGIKLDGGAQTSLAVSGAGASFTLEFDYQVWDTLCPTCTVQVMPGMESTFAGTCAYDGIPGAHPGVSATSSTFNLNAPSTSGKWGIFINRPEDTTCTAGSYLGYGEVIALISVPNILYEAGAYSGNLGDRAATDALCAGSRPAGYTRHRAFIGHSTADSIANMPTNYGISTAAPIKSATGIAIANNWADLVDGNIANTLNAAGIVSTPPAWWSGVAASDGTHID